MARTRQYPPSVDPGVPLPPTPRPGWIFRTFGELLNLTERPVDLQDSEEYDLVTAKRSRGGIIKRERLKGIDILTKTQFTIEADDFLISRRQIVHGACGVVPSSLSGSIVSNEYAVLRTKTEILKEYLAYLSHTSHFQRTCFHSSVGVDIEKMIFKIEDWFKFGIYIPPLPEQRKIIAILTSVDEAIEATQAVIEQLQVVKKAMMAELLTRGIPGRHKQFKKTEIGEIPEEWEVVRLVDVVTLPSGQVDPKHDNHSLLPLIAPNHIESDTGVILKIETASQQNAISGKYLFNPGDVIYSKIRPYLRKAILADCDGLCSADMYPLRSSSRIIPEFLLATVLSDSFSDFTARVSMRTGIPKINREELAQYMHALPSLIEQTEIAQIWRSLQSRNRCEKDVLTQLQALKSALMSVLLTGEVRVTPDP